MDSRVPPVHAVSDMKNASFIKLWIIMAALIGVMWLMWGGRPWPSRSQDTPVMHPMFESLKMFAAALIGFAVTGVRRVTRRDVARTRSLEPAQILVCVCGALMIIVIGNSLPRALGLAGGASIIRFRTPVKDAQDSTILLMLLGLGMACGLGEYEIAGAGTAFVCLLLPALESMIPQQVEQARAPLAVVELPMKERSANV